jgi:hypothetical protein
MERMGSGSVRRSAKRGLFIPGSCVVVAAVAAVVAVGSAAAATVVATWPSLGRRRVLLTEDVNVIRATNNAIFDDIFWVHLAYLTADDGIDRLRALLRADAHYATILAGFEAIDRGRRLLDDASSSAGARLAANDLIWAGNLQLLEHEQRAVVQPSFDLLSCAFARIVSIGAVTKFEVRGVRQEIAYSTSFYLDALTSGIPHAMRAREWPRITRFDDRWRWLETSVVPRFRRFDADMRLVDTSLRRILDEARHYASQPCVLPPSRVDGAPSTTAEGFVSRRTWATGDVLRARRTKARTPWATRRRARWRAGIRNVH